LEFLDTWMTARQMKELGTSLHGPDLSKWPAVDVEAMSLLECEQAAYEDARMKAGHN
jgi:hypothetical protein